MMRGPSEDTPERIAEHEAQRQARDGCGCRSDVTHCVHRTDGNVLRMHKHEVVNGRGVYEWCVWRTSVAAASPAPSDGLGWFTFESYDDALAAFYAAEQALLAGDVPEGAL